MTKQELITAIENTLAARDIRYSKAKKLQDILRKLKLSIDTK